MTIFRNKLSIIVLVVLAVAVHVTFCLSLHYHFLNPLFYITVHSRGQGGPFFGIYQAGVNLLNGDSIYSSERHNPPRNVEVPYYHFYRYLPFVSYISSVVSRILSPWQAYWTWVAINEILLGICIFLTLKLRHIYSTRAIIASTFWLFFSPLYIEFYMGQFSFIMTFFILLLLYPYLKGKYEYAVWGERAHPAVGKTEENRFPIAAAAGWIASILVKSFTFLYTFTFLKMGKKKLATAGILAVALTSIPYFMLRPGDLKWFLHLNFQPLPPTLTGGCFGFLGFMRDISQRLFPQGVATRINIGPVDIAPANIPLVLFALIIISITIYLTFRRSRIDILNNIALWTLAFFLIFKDIWEYHYVMLLPIFVAYYLKTGSRFVLLVFILIALPTPFVLYDVPGVENPQVYWSTPLSILHHSFKAIPTLALFIWVAAREFKSLEAVEA